MQRDWKDLDVMMMMMMKMKVLLRAGRNHGRWQEAATNERLGLSRLLNTCFYLDSRPELRNTEVTLDVMLVMMDDGTCVFFLESLKKMRDADHAVADSDASGPSFLPSMYVRTRSTRHFIISFIRS